MTAARHPNSYSLSSIQNGLSRAGYSLRKSVRTSKRRVYHFFDRPNDPFSSILGFPATNKRVKQEYARRLERLLGVRFKQDAPGS